ncbi:MAG: hypothetical protein KF795_27200 [Labilithrix sp.]|nr:hypothetical protein [Labilithrix sp.]
MRVPLLLLAIAALGCSSAQPAPAPVAECGVDLPDTLTVSEGGRLTLPRTQDMTYEGVGGVELTLDETTVALRAPYLANAEEGLGLRLGCGKTLPIELRTLAWTRLAEWEEKDGANAREYGAWWIDPQGAGALIVFGGFHYVPKQFTPADDAWRFDFASGAWSALAGEGLPTLPGGRAAPIPGERAVLFFGGMAEKSDGTQETPPSLYRLDYDDARVTATKVEPLGDAVGSYTGSLIYDTKRKRWLSVCGLSTATSTGLNCLVHSYVPGGGFTSVATQGRAPKGRYGFHYAYDEASDRVILFGGQVGPENEAIDGETWALDLADDPPSWARLFANGAGPTKRRNGAFAFDPIGHRLFVWGGTPDGRDSTPNIQALNLDRGAEAWTDIATPKEVPSRTSGIGIHDPARERLLFGFGNDDALYRDLWSLDLANVSPR